MAGVLDGLKVVSMELYLLAPTASVYLADWGAEVIKVEPVTPVSSETGRTVGVATSLKVGSVEVNTQYQFRNRNKKSLAVDLKKESGRDILYRLIKKADVFMSNYQSSSLKKLRLDYNNLSRLNPRLILTLLYGASIESSMVF